MALHPESPTAARSNYPLATELALVVAALLALALWERLAREYVLPALGLGPGGTTLGAYDSLLAAGVVNGTVLLAGVGVVVAVYVLARDVEVGVALPAPDRLSTVVGATVTPAVLVVATKLVGDLTGTAYGTLALRSYGAAATVEHVLPVSALGLFVGVPVLLVVCQLLLQGSLRRVVDGDDAVVLTTLAAGFLLVDVDGGLPGWLPEFGTLVGAALFVLALLVARHGSERVEDERLRYLAFGPAALLAGATVLSGVAAIDTVAMGLFVAAQFAVLGVAAYAYERTGSLLAPALTYASLLATSDAVVFFLEAGVQNW